MLDLRAKVSEGEAELRSIELDVEEIRATGREPMHSMSAPLVSGRDFVSERWRVEMTVPAAALARERTRADAVRGRVQVGLAKPSEVEAATAQIAELEAAVEAFDQKLAIRQAFLKAGLTATGADLRGLQAENESRRKASPSGSMSRDATSRISGSGSRSARPIQSRSSKPSYACRSCSSS